MLSIAGLPPLASSIQFAGSHLYTWVERGSVRVKCLAQEHNTMASSRARTRTHVKPHEKQPLKEQQRESHNKI